MINIVNYLFLSFLLLHLSLVHYYYSTSAAICQEFFEIFLKVFNGFYSINLSPDKYYYTTLGYELQLAKRRKSGYIWGKSLGKLRIEIFAEVCYNGIGETAPL
jgi:hypothetical protein